MPRVPFVDEDSEDPVLRRVFGHVEDSWGYVSHLYRTLGQSPVLLEKWIDWSWTLRADCVSDRSLRELVIARTAQRNRVDYEWRHHYPMALEFGVSEAQLEALDGWVDSDLFSPLERAALAVADELTAGTEVSEAVWAELSSHLDARQCLEVVLTAAFYACVSRVLGGLQIPLEESYRRYPAVG
jgi:alkylhydroperoxidase family enzyme